MAAIAVSALLGVALWFAVDRLLTPLSGMDALAARMLVALKCCAVAALFCLFGGVEAVAHERLQSAAFDPLAGHETTRLRVNKQYLQNTLEQFVLFAIGLFGLAAYSESGAAMRGMGAPGMAVSLVMLIYVCARVGGDVAGTPGSVAVVAAFLALEAVLFRSTRGRVETAA